MGFPNPKLTFRRATLSAAEGLSQGQRGDVKVQSILLNLETVQAG